MKILHVSGARIWGGNEQQLEYLVTQLNDKNVNQSLFCYKNTPLENRFTSLNIELHPIAFVKPYKPEYFNALKNAVTTIQPDIIHLHTSDAVTGFVLTDLFKNLGVKTVFSKKGISRKMTFLSRLKYNYKNISEIICVSEMVKTEFGKVIQPKNRSKLSVIPDGFEIPKERDTKKIDLREKLNLPSNYRLIGNISNHAVRKDLPTFIKTADYIINEKKQINTHFVQVGKENKSTSELKEMVKNLQLEKHFTFMGFQPEAKYFYPNFDVFMITSQDEGGPSSVFEAFYAKTPVVATKVGIIPEAVSHEENGFIAPVKDFMALGEAAIKIMNNESLKQKITENAYQSLLKKYTAAQLGDRHYELYSKLLGTNV